ncbi:hypothetical protein [Legionella cardiaca]|uniref:Uncharacterized protein n=1 Tax=Legionella cardiaca TaxID=1071983 RepID=A0ABY8AV49_9GAMM|nr:hypothetical protein [Legionella cardiaca]WED44353.1 hypothetical protein PXX05_06080 [Legionella cardiaca]
MKRGRQSQSNGISVSEACFNDLHRHNAITEEIWMPKEKGNQAGVILIDKNFKKTYVKRYESQDYNNNELTDLVIFMLAKSCGVRVPAVRLVYTAEYAYLFSADMNGTKSEIKNYTYQDLDKWEHSDFDMSTYGQGFFTNKKENFHIDKIATAGLLILSVVLNLTDLSNANLGIVLSEKPVQRKAKIALIDFCCRDKTTLSGDYADSLKAFILERVRSKNTYLFELGKTLSDSSYYLAFEKIVANFMPSLDVALHIINASTNTIKQKDALANLTFWQKNLGSLLGLVDYSKQPTAFV